MKDKNKTRSRYYELIMLTIILVFLALAYTHTHQPTNLTPQIVTSRDSLWVCAYSKEDKEEWMKDINECIKETKEKVDKHDRMVHQPLSFTLQQFCLFVFFLGGATNFFLILTLNTTNLKYNRTSDKDSQTEGISDKDSF